MSDPYPEVSGDESGIVPPQSGRHPDWPKKIRTLTAAELDRLTIDSSGRFYWDGKLVNYEPPQLKPAESHPTDKDTDPLDPAAIEAFDRAAHELRNGKSGEPNESSVATADDDPSSESRRSQAADLSAIDLDRHREVAQVTAAETILDHHLPASAALFRASERVRLKLSAWQSLGALISVLGITAGAAGLAASGFVAAHDWGCRTGLVRSYCPQAPAPRQQPARPDIPA